MIEKILLRRFTFFLFFIVLFAGFLRFVNYSNRWGIAYDQAHDALVARYAVFSHSFPLVAPFSSGAQFQDSGVWYWFLMIPTFLFPNLIIAPWVATTLYCILFVLAISLVGAKIVDSKFGLLVGLLAAVSTSQIGQSTNLSLTALISLVSLCAIFFAFKYFKDTKIINIFWMGFFISLCATIHLQAVLLLVLIPTFLGLAKIKNPKAYLMLFCGLLIPLIPLILFDLKNNFVNISGLVNYAFNNQHGVTYESLGRRWLTYLFSFWPSSWATIIGGYAPVGYLIVASIIIAGFKLIKKIEKIWIVVSVTLLADIVLMRYVRSPLFDSYLNFLHPFVFLLTAYAIYLIAKWNRIIGILILMVIVGGSLHRDLGEIKYAGNNTTVLTVQKMIVSLNKKHPKDKFDFYDFGYNQVGMSLPLVLFMDTAERADRGGIKIGIISDVDATRTAFFKRIGSVSGLTLVDLGNSGSAQLEQARWASINPSSIYKNTQDWYKK